MDILQGAVYKHTVYINDRTAASTPTQCAVLQRFYKCFFASVPGITGQELVNYLDGLYSVLYKPLLNNNAEYRGSSLQRVTGAVPFEIPASIITNAGIGTAGAIAMAKQTAGLVSLRSDFIGKRARGRQYVPFPAAADDAGNGVPTAGYITKLDALGAQLVSFVSLTIGPRAAQLDPVIWARALPTSSYVIKSSLRLGRWATQKRRGDFGRTNVSPI